MEISNEWYKKDGREGKVILSIDIGGTKTRFGLFEKNGFLASPIWAETIPTLYTYNDFINKIRNISEVISSDVEGVGVSFGVAFTDDGRTVLAASKMPDFVGHNLADDFESIFKSECKVAHDCICALIAELEANQIQNNTAYVTVSSGTGGAVMLQSRHEKLFFRSRLAHQIIERNGLLCHCGQKGCLATHTDGIETQKRKNSELGKINDEYFWEEFSSALAIGLVNLSWMYPITSIIIGGGIALNNSSVNSNLIKYFNKTRSTGNQKPCNLSYASLGENSPLIGACFLASDPNLVINY